MRILLIALLFASYTSNAQIAYNPPATETYMFAAAPYQQPLWLNTRRKLFQRNTGMIIGLQRGKYTSLELGGEAHWRKISFLKPHIIGATANLAYNFTYNVLGYHAGIWMKRGPINLTYGANVNYFTDFNNRQSFGFGPSIGFRFFGLHLVNGYTLLKKNNNTKTEEAPLPVNTFYMSLRYYFPVQNQFTWDRQTMKKKRARKKERMKRKKEKQKEGAKENKKKNSGNKKRWNIFGLAR